MPMPRSLEAALTDAMMRHRRADVMTRERRVICDGARPVARLRQGIDPPAEVFG
jgi:hypothetical protein